MLQRISPQYGHGTSQNVVHSLRPSSISMVATLKSDSFAQRSLSPRLLPIPAFPPSRLYLPFSRLSPSNPHQRSPMELFSKAPSSVPTPTSKNLSPLGTLAILPLEIMLQAYHQFLIHPCPLYKAFRPYSGPPSSSLHYVDITLLLLSKTISTEAVDVFYSINTLRIEIPALHPQSQQPIFWYGGDQRVEQCASGASTIPSKLACEHIKNLKISFCQHKLDEIKTNDLGKGPVSLELAKRLKTPRVPRKKLTIELYHLLDFRIVMSMARFIESLFTLSYFETIEIEVNFGGCHSRKRKLLLDGRGYIDRFHTRYPLSAEVQYWKNVITSRLEHAHDFSLCYRYRHLPCAGKQTDF